MGNYFFILYSNFIAKLSRDIIVPSLPMIALYLQISQSEVQYAIVLNLLGIAIARLIWPVLSDLFGHKPIFIITHLIFLLSSLLSLLSMHPLGFITGRFLQGFSIGCLPLITRAFVFDRHGANRTVQIYAYLSLIIAFSPAIATMIGGFLQTQFNWQASFVLLALMSVFGLIYTVFLPDSQARQSHKLNKLLTESRTLLKDLAFWRFILPYNLLLSALFAYFTMAPFILPDMYHLSVITFGSLSFFLFFGIFLGSFISGILVRSLSIETVIHAGLCFSVIAALLLCASLLIHPSLYLYMSLLSLFTVGNGLLNATSKSSIMAAAPDMPGSALAIAGFAGAVLNTLVAFVATCLPATMVTMTVLFMFIALLAFVLYQIL